MPPCWFCPTGQPSPILTVLQVQWSLCKSPIMLSPELLFYKLFLVHLGREMHQSGESTLCSGNSDPRISEVYKNKVTYVIRGACPLRVRCSSALKPLSSGAPIRREAPSYLDLCGSQQRGKMMWYAPVFNVLLGYSHFSGQSRSHNQPVSNGAGMYNPLSERGTEHGEQ